MNILKKIIIFFVISIAGIIANKSTAQFSFSPSNVLSVSLPRNSLKYDSIHISNLSNDTLLMSWNLIQYDSTGGTYIDFCSSGDCWLGVPATGNFPPIIPNGFGWAGVHFWTGNQQGNCIVKIFVYQKNHPENGDTLSYLLQTSNNNFIDDKAENQFSIYPNPASEKLFIRFENNITGLYKYEFSDINGKTLMTFSSNSALNEIPLQNFENGIYFLKIVSNSNYFTRKIIISR